MDPNPYSSPENESPSNIAGSIQSESVVWFSATGFVLLFMAQVVGLNSNGVVGPIFQALFAMAFVAAAYSFLATLLYLVFTLLLPRGATIKTRIIAAIVFFGGTAVTAFVAERICGISPPGIVAFPIAIVMLIAVEFLFLRHQYRNAKFEGN